MKSDLEKTIKGTNYVIKPMITSVGSRILLQLGQLLLPHAQVLTVFELKSTLLELFDKPLQVDEALKKVAANINSEAYAKIVETVLEPVLVVRGDGTKPGDGLVRLITVYDSHFAGNYDELYQVFFHTLKHNYESFFAGLPAIAASVLPLVKKPSSPDSTPAASTTTPPSGG